jgi:hypothetical protein
MRVHAKDAKDAKADKDDKTVVANRTCKTLRKSP